MIGVCVGGGESLTGQGGDKSICPVALPVSQWPWIG